MNYKYTIGKIRITIVYFLSFLLFFNCLGDYRNVQNLKNIEVDFKTLQVRKVETEGLFSLTPKIKIDTEMVLRNPNKSHVTVYSFDFDVFMLDEEENFREILGKILSDKEIIVSAESAAIIPIQIRMEYEEKLTSKMMKIVSKLVTDLMNKKETSFEIAGKIQYKTIFGNISIPIKENVKAKLR